MILSGVALAYSNHFHNGFHFDDAHTVVNNAFIRDPGNIPKFFSDATTFSSAPGNQSYRPLVSTSLAIDYQLGKKLDPFWFQLSDFAAFIGLAALLAYFLNALLKMEREDSLSGCVAMFCAGLYALHPANADTVNYVIARSEIYSTAAILGSFAWYVACPGVRHKHWFVIPAAIGILAKPPAAMFAPLFAVYALLFPEERVPRAGKALRFIKETAPAFLLCGAATFFVSRMTPKTWDSGARDSGSYLMTQPYVALLYFKTFFLAERAFGGL